MAALALAEALARRGHALTLIGLRGSGGEGLRTWIVDRGTPLLLPGEDRGTPPADPGPFPDLFLRISDLARRGGVDVVHLHLIDPPALELAHALASAHPEVTVVATLHVAAVFPATRRAIERILASSTRLKLTAPSRFAAFSYGRGGDRICVIPNGVDVERIAAVYEPPDDRRLAWAGRRSPEKGLAEALAIAQIADRPITIVGPPAETMEAPSPGTARSILEDLGRVPRREVPVILGRAEATLVTSSIPEAHSLVAIESLAAGTPVVAFRSGALGEVIEDGVTGILVTPGDLLEAKDAVDRVRSLSRRSVREAAERRFCHADVVDRFEAVYRA